jgi:hypothetical protein
MQDVLPAARGKRVIGAAGQQEPESLVVAATHTAHQGRVAQLGTHIDVRTDVKQPGHRVREALHRRCMQCLASVAHGVVVDVYAHAEKGLDAHRVVMVPARLQQRVALLLVPHGGQAAVFEKDADDGEDCP